MNVNQMVNYLDRAEIAAMRKRRYLKTVRKLSPNLRRFAVALKRTMVDFRGPECDIRKKVCSACKISTRTYFLNIEKLHKLLP